MRSAWMAVSTSGKYQCINFISSILHSYCANIIVSISVCLYTTSSLHMLSPFREEDDDEYCFVSRGQGLGASVDCQVFNCLDLDDL